MMAGRRAFWSLGVTTAAAMAWRRYHAAVREIDGHGPASPVLPGSIRAVPAPWGVAAYRMIAGDPTRPPLVLVHGWGRTGDSAWWPLAWETDRTLLMVDLPGHGRSRLEAAFSFEVAADALRRVIADADLDRPLLVGHSMGGPVCLTAIRQVGGAAYSGLVVLASSAYWVRPRLWVTLAAAPYVMAPRSPIVVRTQRSRMQAAPGDADRIVWEYASRPPRRLLDESAAALRRFDARTWDDLILPRTVWVVATEDGVIDARHQRASARHLGVPHVDVEAEHSIVVDQPASVMTVIERHPESGLQPI